MTPITARIQVQYLNGAQSPDEEAALFLVAHGRAYPVVGRQEAGLVIIAPELRL